MKLLSYLASFSITLWLFFLVIISHIPTAGIFNTIMSNLIIITIFYFSLFATNNLSIISLIIIGVINDSITGSLLYISSLKYLMIKLVIDANYNILANQGFLVKYFCFIIIMSLISAFEYLIVFMFYDRLMANIDYVGLEICYAVLQYPLLYTLYDKLLIFLKIKNARSA